MANLGEQDASTQVRAQLQSTRGEAIDLSIPQTCTVGDVRDFLVREYGYNPGTRLMYSSTVPKDGELICGFPYGSLVIVTPEDRMAGEQSFGVAGAEQRTRAAPAAPPPPRVSPARRASYHSARGEESRSESSASARPGEQPPEAPAPAAAEVPQLSVESLKRVATPELSRESRTPAAAPCSARSGRGAVFVFRCIAPVLNKTVHLELTDDATVADLHLALAAKDPLLGGRKLIFRGKVLDIPEAKLTACGIRGAEAQSSTVITTNPDENGEYKIFIASDKIGELQIVRLVEIESDVAVVEHLLQDKQPTDQLRRGYYEELMRILFRIDGLQDLDDNWRSRRKGMVKKITEMQDRLKISDED